MRQPRRSAPWAPAAPAALLLATLMLLATAAPALGKEGMEAALDAPIARGTPAGTELVVGITVTVRDGGRTLPVYGSPIYLRLTGPGGDTTRELGREGPERGHYMVRIAVPAGGVAAVEVGIAGTTDLAATLAAPAIVLGAPGPGTARPAAGPASGGAPAAEDAPATGSTAPTVSGAPAPPVGLAIAGFGLAALVLAFAAAGIGGDRWRGRSPWRSLAGGVDHRRHPDPGR